MRGFAGVLLLQLPFDGDKIGPHLAFNVTYIVLTLSHTQKGPTRFSWLVSNPF